MKINVKDLDMEGVSLANWAEDSKQVGTPTMVLLPARNYYFQVTGQHKITLPRKGTYAELEPGYFSESDGEFNLLDSENSIMYLPAISKVLFATKQYPNLKPNQLFAPIAVKYEEEEVHIYGQLVEMLDPNELKSSVDDTIVKEG